MNPQADVIDPLERGLGWVGIGAYGLIGVAAASLLPPLPVLFWVCYGIGLLGHIVMFVARNVTAERTAAIVIALSTLALPFIDVAGGLAFAALVIAAAVVALQFSQRAGYVFVAAQCTVALANPGPNWLINVLLIALLSLFAVFVSGLLLREAAARAELAAAQSKLAETTRAAERLRISRDLHDRVGHQLSALAVNLEAASHLTAGAPAHDHVEQSRLLAKRALSEIREVVSQLRGDDDDPFLARLEAFTRRIPSPRLIVDIAPDFTVDPELAGDLLLATQEAITNAVRHADASAIRVCGVREGDLLRLRITDDGNGVSELAVGNGMRGMVERMSAIGGSAHFDPDPPGFTVELSAPAARSVHV